MAGAFALRFLSALLLFSLVALSAARADVVQLNDGNFEHLTQASTGGTTGAWFIKFYAPWCGHCKALAPVWSQLADELAGEVVVAEVDCTANEGVCSRFSIQSYPTLLGINLGKLFEHKGSRTLPDLAQFARGLRSGELSSSARPVPEPPSLLNDFTSLWTSLENDFHAIYAQNKAVILAVYGVGFAAGLLSFLLLWCLIAREEARVVAVAKKED